MFEQWSQRLKKIIVESEVSLVISLFVAVLLCVSFFYRYNIFLDLPEISLNMLMYAGFFATGLYF